MKSILFVSLVQLQTFGGTVTSEIMQWAIKHHVSVQALTDLQRIFGIPVDAPSSHAAPHTEAWVQSLVRLEAGRKGLKLWRNNVGVLEDERGVPVRYGLANDSKQLNTAIKSGDLIGWRPLLITPAYVGSTVAQFVSRECKRPDWVFTGTERETAQAKWAAAVVKDGGDAKFCTGEGSL